MKRDSTFGDLWKSGPGENSRESTRFGGGHGAFSFFLLDALNGAADQDGNAQVSADETQDYVYTMVRRATNRTQNPRVTGDMPGQRVQIEDTKRAGIEVGTWQSIETTATVRGASED